LRPVVINLNIWMRIAVFLFLSSLPLCALAQKIEAFPPYIGFSVLFDYPWVELTFNGQNDAKRSFAPSNKPRLGIGIDSEYLSGSLTFANVPETSNNTQDPEVKTDYFDFQLHHHQRIYAVDAWFQKYSGLTEELLEDSEVPRSDVTFFNASLLGMYVFSSENFSLRAAFNNSEKQVESGGSFLAFAWGGYQSLAGQNTLLTSADRAEYGRIAQIKQVAVSSLGAGGGYGYTLSSGEVYGTLALLGGMGPQIFRLKDVEGNNVTEGNTAFRLQTRLSMGYNGRRMYSNLQSYIDQSFFPLKNINFNSSTFKIVILFGVRLDPRHCGHDVNRNCDTHFRSETLFRKKDPGPHPPLSFRYLRQIRGFRLKFNGQRPPTGCMLRDIRRFL